MIAAVIFLILLICGKLPGEFFPSKATSANISQQMPPDFDWDNAPVRIHFIDVGQGDAILVEAFGEYVIIDGGDNGSEDQLLAYLWARKVRDPLAVMVTHYHNDHLGGIPEVLEEYPPKNLFVPPVPEEMIPQTRTYYNFRKAAESAGITVTEASAGTVLDLGNRVTLTVLSPFSDEGENLNETSLVCRIAFGETSFLLTSDAEDINEERMLEAYGSEALGSTLLKLGHHGSTTSTTSNFLQAVSPQIAVITAGENNDFGHPHKPVTDRLAQKNIPLYRTDQNGTIVVSSDGKHLAVKTQS